MPAPHRVTLSAQNVYLVLSSICACALWVGRSQQRLEASLQDAGPVAPMAAPIGLSDL